MLWVDKYKPKTIDDLVGLSGIAEKLKTWLVNWDKTWKGPNADKGLTTGPNKKAALLSGGPGIGKTTVATIIAEYQSYFFI